MKISFRIKAQNKKNKDFLRETKVERIHCLQTCTTTNTKRFSSRRNIQDRKLNVHKRIKSI